WRGGRHSKGRLGRTAPQTDTLRPLPQIDLAQIVLAHQRYQRFDRAHIKWAWAAGGIVSHLSLPSELVSGKCKWYLVLSTEYKVQRTNYTVTHRSLTTHHSP